MEESDEMGWVVETDDWTKTTDRRERKRIQDRLAQRAHRKRLREEQASTDRASSAGRAQGSPPCGSSGEISSHAQGGPPTAQPHLASAYTAGTPSEGPASSDALISIPRGSGSPRHASPRRSVKTVDPDSFYLIMRCQTVVAALQSNAASIPVYCDILTPSVLNVTNIKDPPQTLTPTSLQTEVPHLAFVAALPFASLRDSILKALPQIDYDDLWRDAVGGGFFVWGSVSWMPHGWEVTEEFAAKWWFLLDRDVVDTANYWRLQRGLSKLNVSKRPWVMNKVESASTEPTD